MPNNTVLFFRMSTYPKTNKVIFKFDIRKIHTPVGIDQPNVKVKYTWARLSW